MRKNQMRKNQITTINSSKETIPNGLSVSLDWISFTVSEDKITTFPDVVNLLGFHQEDFKKEKTGRFGYKSRYVLNTGGHMEILCNGCNEDMGIHVIVPGGAVSDLLTAWKEKRMIETPFGEKGMEVDELDYTILLDLLNMLSSKAKFKRIDLAIDNIGDLYYSCDEVFQKLEDKLFASRFRVYSRTAPAKLKDGKKEGDTLNLGKRSSDTFLRIYDKKLEYKAKHGIDFPESWVRWELELKNDRANMAVQKILEWKDLSSVCLGILNNYLHLTTVDAKGKHILDPKWDAFINQKQRIRLYVPSSPKTIKDLEIWVDKQVGAAIAAIVVSYDGKYDFFIQNMPKWLEKLERNNDYLKRLSQCSYANSKDKDSLEE